MRVRILRRVLLYGALAALPLAVCGYAGLRAYARAAVFPGSDVRLPAEDELPERTRIVRYAAGDGTPLHALWTECGRAGAPAVLYFHGNAESAAANLPLATALAARGIDVFLAEYRGYAGLGGRPSEKGVCADAEAAREELARLGVTDARLVLVGRSLGAAVAMDLAARSRAALVLLVSPFTSVTDVGRSVVGPLAPLVVPRWFDSLSKARRIDGPVTVLHGTDDEVIPYAMGERLAGAIRGARLVPLRGRGHNDIPELPALIAGEVERVFPGVSGRGSS